MTAVAQRKLLRSHLLRRIYEMVDGRLASATGVYWSDEHLREGLGAELSEIEAALDYLTSTGLLSEGPAMGVYGLTKKGVDEIEDLLEAPDKPTTNLGPLVVQNIYNSGQMAIAHGEGHSISQTTSNTELPKELEDLRTKLRPVLGDELQSKLDSLLATAVNGGSQFEIAARVEPIAASGEKARTVLKTFSDEAIKELAKAATSQAVAGGSWLLQHGKQLVDGISMVLRAMGL